MMQRSTSMTRTLADPPAQLQFEVMQEQGKHRQRKSLEIKPRSIQPMYQSTSTCPPGPRHHSRCRQHTSQRAA